MSDVERENQALRRALRLAMVPIDILYGMLSAPNLFVEPFQRMIKIAWETGHTCLKGQLPAQDQQLLNEARSVIAWLAEREDFDCNCEPTYESDTNVYNHLDECPSMVELGVEATLTNLERAIESAK